MLDSHIMLVDHRDSDTRQHPSDDFSVAADCGVWELFSVSDLCLIADFEHLLSTIFVENPTPCPYDHMPDIPKHIRISNLKNRWHINSEKCPRWYKPNLSAWEEIYNANHVKIYRPKGI